MNANRLKIHFCGMAAIVCVALLVAAPLHRPRAATLPMDRPPVLSTAGAVTLLDEAVRKADRELVRLCIAVVDSGGSLLAFRRLEGAAPGCPDAAIAKARSAAINRVNTIVFYELARRQNPQIGDIPGILPAVAGVIIRHDGRVVGSIGIAGGPSDAEEQKFATELAIGFEAELSRN